MIRFYKYLSLAATISITLSPDFMKFWYFWQHISYGLLKAAKPSPTSNFLATTSMSKLKFETEQHTEFNQG